uniref:Out at first protein-like n=2 Tax=Hirondellea gigas TaxID=1518452 RepID=A0A2P2HX42_9CRUS
MKMKASCSVILLLLAAFWPSFISCTTLVVNVKSQNGDVFQEAISANHSDDWVSLEYMQPDATHVTHLIDFKQELQVVHVVRLGEEELRQKPYQEMCFITKFLKEDYISSDAMTKLRQKNPWTVRTPEEDRGTEQLDMDLSLDVGAVGGLLSQHIPTLCSTAQTTTFASSRDLKTWLNDRQDVDSDWAAVSDASHQQPSRGVTSCSQLPSHQQLHYNSQQPCICQQEVCLWWYPCGLKFCRDRDDSGKSMSYRCGIRTCKKCRLYAFYAASRGLCI